MEWINLKDGLPPKADYETARPHSGEVLVTDGDFVYLDYYFFDTKGWRNYQYDYTHWMPVPPLPEE